MPFRIRVFLSIFLALFVLLLVGPLLLPASRPEGTVPARDLAGSDSRFTEVGGLRVHYLEAGRGPGEFLLLHGYPSNAEGWREVLPELALYGRVVAFDHPGFGLSARPPAGSWPRGENPYRPQAQTEQALALLTELDLDRPVWVAHSSAALTALRAALEHPERVAALVLVDPAVYQAGAPPAWLRPLLHTPQMSRVGPLLMRQLQGEPGRDLFASQWADPERADDEHVSAFQQTFRVDGWDRALWEVTKASREPEFLDRLADVQVPVLVVAGAQDQIVPPQQSERLAAQLPNATLALIEECGHVTHQECPSQLMSVLIDWLERERQEP